ncbi:exosome complex component Rrp45 [Rhynchophorus ferrugineus]|uniref:Exosome complex component RRP45 n=1 Tax=Rhynchophorus ferrugineus TaxID=354439 RepID=A0A834III5_RHYFE|nr:hypothetical protein GWI33_005809 [Rhynchophorus ferrugineus]
MAAIRKTIISNCEKTFLMKNLSEWNRLDGRSFTEFRDINIVFGKDWGCCKVSLGKTEVIAQVSCELQQTKSSRPNEGMLNINLELNTMADPSFDASRQSDLSSQLNRLLEKCIKDSKAVDLESLCIKMNERAWSLRVDINVLNNEGNILDCASVAAITALSHFRRPDVTCDGVEYKIHSIKQRDPIPTVIHHYPVCISYAILNEGEYILADPTLLEEGVAEAFLTIGLNSYKELCGLHLGGNARLATKDILETSSKAAKRATELVAIIKNAVEKDTQDRLKLNDIGFHIMPIQEKIEKSTAELSICLDQWTLSKKGKKKKSKNEPMDVDPINENNSDVQQCKETITPLGNGTAKLSEVKGENEWAIVESDEEAEVIFVEPPKADTVSISDSNSEEEQVVVLNPQRLKKSPSKRKKNRI